MYRILLLHNDKWQHTHAKHKQKQVMSQNTLCIFAAIQMNGLFPKKPTRG